MEEKNTPKTQSKKSVSTAVGVIIIGCFVVGIITIFSPAPQEQASTSQPVANTTTPSSPAPAAPAELSPIDKGWKAVDESIKTREGVDVKVENGAYTITRNYKDYLDDKHLVNLSLTDFVNVGKNLFANGATNVAFTSETEFSDTRGNKSVEVVMKLDSSKELFAKYQWDNIKFREIGTQLMDDMMLVDWHPSLFKDSAIQKAKYTG